MKILILGGTMFLGRWLVEAALQRGHEVTLFNRGKTNPDLFPQVGKITGDRSQSVAALEGRRWEAVIDTSGYVPRIVRMAVEQLKDQVDHYTFISSISAYKDMSQPGTDENAPVATLEDESTETVTGDTYGALKALCEQTVQQVMPGRALVIRPGLIVGPHDPTDRFTYWPVRVARGGDVLAPGRPERQIQIIDVRDLAEWNIRMIEGKQVGVYNATGPLPELTMGGLLETCRQVSGAQAEIHWVDEGFLLDQHVEPWMQLPVWVPEIQPEYGGFMAADISRAVEAGLTFRPLASTVRDTLEWARTRPEDHRWRAGMAPEREQELLDLWKEEVR